MKTVAAVLVNDQGQILPYTCQSTVQQVEDFCRSKYEHTFDKLLHRGAWVAPVLMQVDVVSKTPLDTVGLSIIRDAPKHLVPLVTSLVQKNKALVVDYPHVFNRVCELLLNASPQRALLFLEGVLMFCKEQNEASNLYTTIHNLYVTIKAECEGLM